MPGPPTSAFTQATLVFSGEAVPRGAVVTFGMGTPSVLETFEGISAAFAAAHQEIATTHCRLDRIEYKIGPVATGPTFPFPVGQNGIRGAGAAAPNTAVLVTKAINGLTGRLFGRAYWPGVPEASIDNNGALASGYRTTCQEALIDLHDAIETLTSGAYVFHTNISDPSPVAAFLCDTRAATQRRRLR